MKWVLVVIAAFLALMGIVYILQGTGVVPVGGMAYHIVWAYVGAVEIIVAAGLGWLAFRPARKQG